MTPLRKTKILVTLGPSTFSKNMIWRLIRVGVNGFRLNFSHGTHEEKEKIIRIIREIEEHKKLFIPIVGDLQGPVVRVGKIGDLTVKRGDTVYLINNEKGNAEKKEIPIPNERLYSMIEEGDVVLIESGRVVLNVRNVLDFKIKAEVLVDGVIKSEKTLAIKNKDIPLPTLSEKDVQDVKFAVEKDLDYIGLSFVRTARDIKGLREILNSLGGENIRILSKIETRRGVENLRWIVKESDAILVARGDLAIYYDLEKIPEVQRNIVKTTRELGKPVLIATQLLDSMCENPVPSRSEVVDVVTAIREGVDALLLTGETAIGKYPVESVIWLSRIILEGEKSGIMEVEPKEEELYDRFAHGIVQLSESLEAKIAAYTRKGTTAYRLARYRPTNSVYAFTPMLKAARQLGLLRGVKAYTIDETDPQKAFPKMIEFLKDKQEITLGDIVILTAGMTAGATDTIRVEKIGVS